MTELDLEIPALAKELIDEYGKPIVYKFLVTGGYDPSTSSVISSEVTQTPSIKAIVEPDNGQSLKAGLVEAADLKLTIYNQGLIGKPSPEDFIVFDGMRYKVKLASPTYSGELIAIWELYVVGEIIEDDAPEEGGELDFSDPAHSGLLALILEDT